MSTETSQVDDLHLVALPTAVSCADLFVRFTLSEWSLSSLATEVSRVVGHRVSAVVDDSTPGSPSFVTIRLRLSGGSLVAEVQDNVIGDLPAGSAPIGGTLAVHPLSLRGHVMHAELPLPLGMTAAAVALPRRDARRSMVEEQAAGQRQDVEPEVLRRVLSSLHQWSR